jgi:hypothetical protein
MVVIDKTLTKPSDVSIYQKKKIFNWENPLRNSKKQPLHRPKHLVRQSLKNIFVKKNTLGHRLPFSAMGPTPTALYWRPDRLFPGLSVNFIQGSSARDDDRRSFSLFHLLSVASWPDDRFYVVLHWRCARRKQAILNDRWSASTAGAKVSRKPQVIKDRLIGHGWWSLKVIARGAALSWQLSVQCLHSSGLSILCVHYRDDLFTIPSFSVTSCSLMNDVTKNSF